MTVYCYLQFVIMNRYDYWHYLPNASAYFLLIESIKIRH